MIVPPCAAHIICRKLISPISLRVQLSASFNHVLRVFYALPSAYGDRSRRRIAGAEFLICCKDSDLLLKDRHSSAYAQAKSIMT